MIESAAHPPRWVCLSLQGFTADVYMKCSFAVQGLCVGAVVGGVSVWMRVHVYVVFVDCILRGG